NTPDAVPAGTAPDARREGRRDRSVTDRWINVDKRECRLGSVPPEIRGGYSTTSHLQEIHPMAISRRSMMLGTAAGGAAALTLAACGGEEEAGGGSDNGGAAAGGT